MSCLLLVFMHDTSAPIIVGRGSHMLIEDLFSKQVSSESLIILLGMNLKLWSCLCLLCFCFQQKSFTQTLSNSGEQRINLRLSIPSKVTFWLHLLTALWSQANTVFTVCVNISFRQRSFLCSSCLSVLLHRLCHGNHFTLHADLSLHVLNWNKFFLCLFSSLLFEGSFYSV